MKSIFSEISEYHFKGQKVEPGTKCWVAGWGDEYYGANAGPDLLLETDVEIVSDEECVSKLEYFELGVTPSIHICADFSGEKPKDSCSGLVCDCDKALTSSSFTYYFHKSIGSTA